MVPWKVFIRSVGVVTLLATGGLVAGQNVVPFSNVSRSVGTQAVVDETTAADDTDVTPAVDEAALPADDGSTTTTTEVPGSAAPDLADPGGTTDPTTPPVDKAPEKPETPTAPTTTTPPTAAPDQGDTTAPPAAPAEDGATVVCAAAAETPCGPSDPELAADSRFDARVQRCQAWWNRLADRLETKRPEWAARARQVADRCAELVTRWQERQDRRNEKRARGDHNCDGRPDNGWHRTDGPHPATGERCTAPQPTAGEAKKGARPETAPGRTKQASRHSEGRR